MKKKNIDIQASAETQLSAEKPLVTDTPGAARVGLKDQFLSSLSLVCRLPLPFSFSFSAARLDFWLPVTSLFQSIIFVLGLAAGALLLRDLALAVLTALILQYSAFNLFHFDGLLDTADAFLGAFEREKRFQILKDPRIGVYGIFTAIMYLAFKFLLLNSILNFLFPASVGVGRFSHNISVFPSFFLLLLFPLAGKTAASLIPALYEPAKQEGLGALAAGSKFCYTLLGCLFALALYLAVPFLLFILVGPEPPLSLNLAESAKTFWQSADFFRPQLFVFIQYFLGAALLTFISALISGRATGRLYNKGLGGYTGDSLGASIELGELLYLLGLFVWIQHS